MKLINVLRDYWQRRIAKPADVIKQPWLDLQRAISSVIYGLIKRRSVSRPYPEKVQKILLIRRNRLGDAINVTPLITGLKQIQPELEIHVLANAYNRVIFEYTPGLAKVHVIDERWGLGKLTLFRHPLLKALRNEQFDLVIGLGGYSSVLAQLVYWVKGRYNIGVVSKKGSLYDLLYDKAVIEQGHRQGHHVDDMAFIVREAGLTLPTPLPMSVLTRPNQPQGKWLALCPDVKRKQSRYSVAAYAEIVEYLLANGVVERVCLFTEGPESEYRQLEQHGAIWCPTTSLASFLDEASKCHCAISAEGGSAHILGALGLPLVVLSGMGHQNYWRPYAEQIEVFDLKDALHSLYPQQVTDALHQLIAGT